MRRYSCKSLSIMTAAAAAGILLPLSVQGMQELPVVPLSDQQGPSQLAPEDTLAPAITPVPPPAPIPIDSLNGEGVDEEEPMLRGPVHEAFAEQFNQNPVQGLIVPPQPPEPIEELPPEVCPDGRQIEWIAGYWAWDDDDQDFFWVSGIWRDVPQGFRWLPGYWTQVETGYQWVSGTWISEQTEEIQYVEAAPPESLELGPVGDAPSQEHIWIPGCWNWNARSYAWRPGYWGAGYNNWIWVPARHVWTPRGYLGCNGYWDYPLNRRGLLFAPYRCRRSAHWNRSRRFTPQVVIATNLLHWNLWVRPRSCHYYFGDYYGPRYARTGFQPWHQFNQQRRQFDPLYSHFSRSAGMGNVSFYDQVNGRFNLLTSHADRRPVRTFNHHDGRELSRRINNDDRSPQLGSTLQQHMKDAGNTRFVKLQEDQRSRLQTDTKSLRQLMDQRREVENRARLETTRLHNQTNDSVGRSLTTDQRDIGRRDNSSDPETRHGGKRNDLAETVKSSSSKEGERSDRLRLPAVDSQKGNTLNNLRDRAARSVKQPDHQAEDKAANRQVRPETDNHASKPRRSNGSVESLPDTGRVRRNEQGPTTPTGNASAAAKTKTSDAVRSAVERPNSRPSIKTPPSRVERESRPPSAGKPVADAVPRRVNPAGNSRSEIRTAPPSRPAVERTHRADPAPAARPHREPGNPAAGSGEHRKKK